MHHRGKFDPALHKLKQKHSIQQKKSNSDQVFTFQVSFQEEKVSKIDIRSSKKHL